MLLRRSIGIMFFQSKGAVFFPLPAFAKAAGSTVTTAGGAFFPHMPDGQKYGGKDYNQDHGSSH